MFRLCVHEPCSCSLWECLCHVYPTTWVCHLSSCQVFQSKDVPNKSTTPEEFIRMTKGITMATVKAAAAGNSAQQEDAIATANLSRKAIFDMLTTCKVLIQSRLPGNMWAQLAESTEDVRVLSALWLLLLLAAESLYQSHTKEHQSGCPSVMAERWAHTQPLQRKLGGKDVVRDVKESMSNIFLYLFFNLYLIYFIYFIFIPPASGSSPWREWRIAEQGPALRLWMHQWIHQPPGAGAAGKETIMCHE